MSEADVRTPQHDLPSGPEPVKAEPFWRQLPQLFFVPLLIVLVCVAIYAVFGVLGGETLSAPDLLTEIQTTHDERRRDQCAFELAMSLSRPNRAATPGLAAQLGQLLENEELPVATRAYLALALGQLGDEARPVLATAVSSPHGEVQAHAGLALGMIGTPNEVDSLLELAQSDKPILQKVALLAVARIAEREKKKPEAERQDVRSVALKLGQRQLSSQDFQVGWNAALILSQLDDASGLHILRRLTDRDFVEKQIRRAYAENLDAEVAFLPMEVQDSVPAGDVPRESVQKLLVDTCKALGRVGGAEEVPLLRQLAADSADAPEKQAGFGVLELSVFGLLGLTGLLFLLALVLKKSQLSMAGIALGLLTLCLAPLGDYTRPEDRVAQEAGRAVQTIEARLAAEDNEH